MQISRKEFMRMAALTAAYAGASGVLAKPPPYGDFPIEKMTRSEACRDVATYLRMKFRMDVTDPSTGLGSDDLRQLLFAIKKESDANGEAWYLTKAKCFATLVEKMAIDVSPLDWFPAISIWDRWNRPFTRVMWARSDEVNKRMIPEDIRRDWHKGNVEGRWTMWQDFDHSVPDWRVILQLGFPGMKERLLKYAKPNDPFRTAGGRARRRRRIFLRRWALTQRVLRHSWMGH